MIGPKLCPFCKAPASQACKHLALAAPGRDFVTRCVELCHGQREWQALCANRRAQWRGIGEWSSEREDFTWLETAFSNEFLQQLAWFGGLDHEWRSEGKSKQGGFYVILWSREPRRLWWELRDEFERQSCSPLSSFSKSSNPSSSPVPGPGLRTPPLEWPPTLHP